MTFEEQNLTIAEFLGTHTVSREMASWNKPSVPEENIHIVTDKNGKKARYWTQTVNAAMYDIGYIHVLRYNTDLNAMHEAEKLLTEEHQWSKYTTNIADIVTLADREKTARCSGFHMSYVCATAAQRAEAFLKTIGKWEE